MPRFQRLHDPDRPGQLLLEDGEPAGVVYWSHDYGDRTRTGWFLERLDEDGEADDGTPRALDVAPEIAQLVADRTLDRSAWLARAETVELVTASAALAAAEHVLAHERRG